MPQPGILDWCTYNTSCCHWKIQWVGAYCVRACLYVCREPTINFSTIKSKMNILFIWVVVKTSFTRGGQFRVQLVHIQCDWVWCDEEVGVWFIPRRCIMWIYKRWNINHWLNALNSVREKWFGIIFSFFPNTAIHLSQAAAWRR